MVQVQKTITMGYEQEKKITEYCKSKDIPFSKFLAESAINKIKVSPND